MAVAWFWLNPWRRLVVWWWWIKDLRVRTILAGQVFCMWWKLCKSARCNATCRPQNLRKQHNSTTGSQIVPSTEAAPFLKPGSWSQRSLATKSLKTYLLYKPLIKRTHIDNDSKWGAPDCPDMFVAAKRRARSPLPMHWGNLSSPQFYGAPWWDEFVARRCSFCRAQGKRRGRMLKRVCQH